MALSNSCRNLWTPPCGHYCLAPRGLPPGAANGLRNKKLVFLPGLVMRVRARAYHAILAFNRLSRQKRPAPRKRVPSICFHGAIERCAVACSSSPAGNFAGYKEMLMNRYRKLAVRSDRGHITPPAETFTSGYVRETASGYQPVPDSAVVDTALNIVAKRVVRGSVLSSPKAVKDFLVLRLADMEHEIFGVVLLSTRHELIDFVELFRGCLDGASVHIREIAKLVLARNAAAVLLCHLHPSGVCTPSQADEMITRRVREGLSLLEVKTLDHIIVGGRNTYSFAEAGLL